MVFPYNYLECLLLDVLDLAELLSVRLKACTLLSVELYSTNHLRLSVCHYVCEWMHLSLLLDIHEPE